ncbi:hypothetical protein M758_4G250700 [Ceratodon purpureus]|uniref:Uncharacterized protein n=1 Tax=Ceratodon purpureus TaxID=3225 RepID=A0A8T0ID85_CERPU|nr:hypothetical protein KC19_4G246100 [Ceratodon purpureus]KAG0620865.1 hypothetical protein M758_4G250700 [Ceratodon purpureus]
MGDVGRGTVTPLSESISVEDAENAAKKVAETIQTQMQELQTLQGFSDENRSLQKLLLELPDLVSYNIMVPFGKAAFMPGRLIHTNEFMVLLGEGYYAERSAKQAAEILKRHSELIKTKVDALKEQIKDLEAEETFVKETAAEAAGGLVDIREPYVDPSLQPVAGTTKTNDTATTATQDENETDSDSEHSRIMARLAELEMAEEAAGEDEDIVDEDEDQDDVDEDAEEVETNLRAAFRRSLLDDSDEDEEDEDEEDEEEDELDFDDRTAANTLLNTSTVRLSEIEEEDGTEEIQSSIITSQHGSQAQSKGLGTQRVGAKPTAGPSGQRHVQFSTTEHIAKSPTPEPLPPRDIKASAGQQRAFSGSVVERNTDLVPPQAPTAPEAPPSRPVSKFKQRKG